MIEVDAPPFGDCVRECEHISSTQLVEMVLEKNAQLYLLHWERKRSERSR
jgi:hypothetical protein